MIELLSAGDHAAMETQTDDAHEPVPSAFFEELETSDAAR
jgi:hypothetical protein